ncbi:hypothetical protein KEJ36_06185, partial [Candidatus Bathyarchaeota archaeon]|nr:hypothetical protein [Candidatus Bathyarchaeota archaeon]
MEEPAKTIERGFKLVNIGLDVGFLTSGATSALQRARAAKVPT